MQNSSAEFAARRAHYFMMWEFWGQSGKETEKGALIEILTKMKAL